MPVKRRLRGFERAGSLPCGELGLPAARARALVLSVAWRRVAGDAIARRAHASGVRRGVLEVCVDDDEHWFETVRSLVPRLAGRLAALYPELGVRRLRLRRTGSSRAERSEPVVLAGGDPIDARPTVPERPTGEVERVSGSLSGARVERVARRYLDRVAADGDA